MAPWRPSVFEMPTKPSILLPTPRPMLLAEVAVFTIKWWKIALEIAATSIMFAGNCVLFFGGGLARYCVH
jgi:hypothetical protein